MPVLTVHGIPQRYPKQRLEKLWNALRTSVSAPTTLNLKPEDIFVFFFDDQLQKGLGEEIVIFIDLFRGPERGPEMLRVMSKLSAATVREYFATAAIECLPRPLDPTTSFRLERVETAGDPGTDRCRICDAPTRKLAGGGGMLEKCVNCGEEQERRRRWQ